MKTNIFKLLAVVLFSIALLGFVHLYPKWQTALLLNKDPSLSVPTQADIENKIRTTLISTLTGLGVIFGLVWTSTPSSF